MAEIHVTDQEIEAALRAMLNMRGDREPELVLRAGIEAIHRATEARKRGWRLHIRVTESNTPPAESGFIRQQNQVYVPREFGW